MAEAYFYINMLLVVHVVNLVRVADYVTTSDVCWVR